jgi:hypothetical protein
VQNLSGHRECTNRKQKVRQKRANLKFSMFWCVLVAECLHLFEDAVHGYLGWPGCSAVVAGV